MGDLNDIKLLEKIDLYIFNKLSKEERIDFEKLMNEDESLKEEVFIQKQLYSAFGNDSVLNNPKFPLEETEKIQNELQSDKLKDISLKIKNAGIEFSQTRKIDHTTNLKSKKTFSFKLSIAASISILIASCIYYFMSQTSMNSYYNEYNDWNSLPSFSEQGSHEINLFLKGENLFQQQNFSDAIQAFEKTPHNTLYYPYSLLYIGACYERLDNNNEALKYFQKAASLSNFDEKSRAYWYQFLLYLKIEDKENAIRMQKIILEDDQNYNYKIASKIDL